MSHGFLSPDRFIERTDRNSGPAWHRLGEVFEESLKITAREAAVKVGGDFEIYKCPSTVELPKALGGGTMQTGNYSIIRGPMRGDEVVRSFGACKEEFSPIQNLDLADLLDRGLSEAWPLETCGVLGQGERMFYVLRMGKFNPLGIGGDATQEMEFFYMLARDLRPGGGVHNSITTVKAVCQNTLELALSEAAINIKIQQVNGVEGRLELVNGLMLEVQRSQQAAQAQIERLARLQLKKGQLEKLIAAAYPEPKKPGVLALWEQAGADDDKLKERNGYLGWKKNDYEWLMRTTQEYRVAAVEMMERINESEKCIAGTAWAAVNAVTELADWIKPSKGKGDLSDSIVFGDRAVPKARVMKAALALK